MKTRIFNRSILRGFLIASVVTLCAGKSFSQEREAPNVNNNEVAVAVGGMFSSLDYDLAQGEVSQGAGYNIGFRYSYYLNAQWSLGLGVGYQSYEGLASLGKVQGAYSATDFEEEGFEFRYVAENYREEQNISTLEIPLNLQYETRGEYTRVYFMAGAKLMLPIKSTYMAKASSLSTSGYYGQYDVELFDPAFAGFGQYGAQESAKRDLDLNMGYAVIAEIGLKQRISSNSFIYIGGYIDYGLNSMIDEKADKNLIAYQKNSPSKFGYNSVFETGYAKDLKLISFGVKLRYALGF